MTPMRPIMDAGPGLNFFALHKERLLFATLGPLCIPNTVAREIRGKVRGEQRFAPAAGVLAKIPERLLEILDDGASQEMQDAFRFVSDHPYAERIRDRDDLGETMVLAHAVIRAHAGHDVIVLIDERQGRHRAARQQERLERRRRAGHVVGRLSLISTQTVLEKAAADGNIADRAEMRGLYERLRALDDGLIPLKSTGLMHLQCWG